MKIYTAKAGDELNLICYKFYNSLDESVLDEFYRANFDLLLKPLKGGELVNLPNITIKQSRQKTEQLWD